MLLVGDIVVNASNIPLVREQTIFEEISNAISHGIGAVLSIVGAVLMIILSAFTSDALGIVSASIYGGSLILLYCSSTLYHSLTNKKAKRIFQIFDHCSIFLLILGTYAPCSLVVIGGTKGIGLFSVVSACCILGIILNAINLKKFHKVCLVLDVIAGWMIIFNFKNLYSSFGFGNMMFLLGGGLAYTIGIYFYKSKEVLFSHFVWHLFVLAGSALQFVAVINAAYIV